MRLSKSVLLISGLCFFCFQLLFIGFQHHNLHVEEVYAQVLSTASSVAFIALIFALTKFDEAEITTELKLIECFFAFSAVGFQAYNILKIMTR